LYLFSCATKELLGNYVLPAPQRVSDLAFGYCKSQVRIDSSSSSRSAAAAAGGAAGQEQQHDGSNSSTSRLASAAD
jgi:hypothetical protein